MFINHLKLKTFINMNLKAIIQQLSILGGGGVKVQVDVFSFYPLTLSLDFIGPNLFASKISRHSQLINSLPFISELQNVSTTAELTLLQPSYKPQVRHECRKIRAQVCFSRSQVVDAVTEVRQPHLS